MRIFEHPNLEDGKWKCPICQTNDDKPIALIPIADKIDGNIVECRQYHVECIESMEYKRGKDVYLIMKMEDMTNDSDS